MTPERWEKLNELFHRAIQQPPDARRTFLDTACAADETLRIDVERLVRAHEHAEGFLTTSSLADALQRPGIDLHALVGRTIGGYEVLAHIGTGGMGDVFVARSTALERKVALKLLPPHLTGNDAHLQRFIQEGKLASALNHPNIITIYEIGHAGDLHFIVTELIEGETLRDRLARGPLDVPTTLDIAVQVATALTAAHAAGVVHRDIKPENVMLRQDGYVKVLDFGIAQLIDSRELIVGAATGTPASAPIGTARYMSPEQAQGLNVDERSDLFSFGAVVYEMLAGRPPFQGATQAELLRAIREHEPPPLSETRPDIPKTLESIVGRMLQKAREARYQSARNVLNDLKAVQRALQRGADLPRRKVLIGAAAALAALSATLMYRGFPSPSPTDITIGRKLAVLPFINLKPAPETDFLSYSLAETISARLAPIRTLTVTPSSAVYKYRGETIDPMRAAQELKADTVLTGHYLKDGDTLRISAQLMDATNARAIFQDEFSVKYDRLLTLHDTVARQLISALNLTLSPAELDGLRRDMPSNPTAWELYLRGIDHLEGARLPLAIDALEKSVSLDPQFSWGWTELGAAYIVNAAVRFGGGEMYTKAQAAFDRAIALSPADPRPRIMFSDMLIETNRVEQAVPLLRAIVRENPRHAGAIWQLGYAYRYAGMLDESAQAGQAAYDVDPGFTPRSTVFNTWLYLGQYARFRDSVPQREGSAYTRFYQGFADYHLGNFAAAARAFDEAYALDPQMLQARVGKALSHHLAARQGDGLRLLRETARQLEERGLNDAEGVYKVAQAFAVLGDRMAAIHWLESSITGGFFCYPYISTDPLLDTVRQLPQFRAALEQARERHEAFRRTFF